jgi:hypothetical protein
MHMARTRHKIPTGLTIEDRFIAYGALSLSLRQFLLLLGGTAIGYGGVWQGWSALPAPLRACVAFVPPLLALAVALARPSGRALESWAFVLLRHWSRPRVAIWSPRPPRPADWRSAGPGWAELPTTGVGTRATDTAGGKARGDASKEVSR